MLYSVDAVGGVISYVVAAVGGVISYAVADVVIEYFYNEDSTSAEYLLRERGLSTVVKGGSLVTALEDKRCLVEEGKVYFTI